MVMHAMFYDVLVKGVVLYTLGVTIEFLGKIAYYYPRWQIKTSHKTSLPMRFIEEQTRSPKKSTMLVGFLGLLHGLELLEGNIHYHIYQDAPQNGELAMSGLKAMLIIPLYPLDPRPPWGTLNEF
jgi:hypothetical protein